jgi:hypothetical protein
MRACAVAVSSVMDLPSFLIGLLPVVAIGFVCVVAFLRRHDRKHASPMILNPYTLAIEPDADALGHLPGVQPAPGTTSSRGIDTASLEPEGRVGGRGESFADSPPPKEL